MVVSSIEIPSATARRKPPTTLWKKDEGGADSVLVSGLIAEKPARNAIVMEPENRELRLPEEPCKCPELFSVLFGNMTT